MTSVGDKVQYKGKEYEITRDRLNGMVDLAQIERRPYCAPIYRNPVWCVYRDELDHGRREIKEVQKNDHS